MNLDFILGSKSFSLTGDHDPKARLSRALANRNMFNTNHQLSMITGAQKFGAEAKNHPARPGRKVASSSPAPSPSQPSAKPTPTSAPARPATAVKGGLAGGSQAAVVKLASYSSGRSSIGNLLNYQSREGELALEREDGESLKGKEQLRELIDQWTEESSGREKSKDVLTFRAVLTAKQGEKQIELALAEALRGHRYAFRIEEKGDEQRIHVVTSAASSCRENNRAFRIYDNSKSLDALEDRLSDSFKSEVILDLPKWRHGVSGASEALFGLTRGGQIEAKDNSGKSIKDDKQPLLTAKSWERDLRSKGTRDLAHLIISAKPGTEKQAFVSAARAMLNKEFPGHEYAFALHEDRQHLHVHVALRMESKYGERLDPKIQDFRRWRETMAEMARDRFIPMEATNRFDQAHKPGYKLKDVKMIERGTAPESVRRRVEAVKTREVHVPTREEGKRRANESFQQWQQVVATPRFVSPSAIPSDQVRLYRGEQTASVNRAPIFTTNRASAELHSGQSGRLIYVDVPKAQLATIQAAHSGTERFVLSREQADNAREITRVSDAQVIAFVDRSKKAIEAAPIQQIQKKTVNPENPYQKLQTLHQMFENSGDNPMSVETLTKQRDAINVLLDDIQSHIPHHELDKFAKARKELMAGANEIIEEMRERSAQNPKINGTGEKPHKPHHLDGFTFEVRNGEVHYQPHEESGLRLTTAFVDKGKSLEIWKRDDDKAILAALQVAQDKWETITVTGSEKYKETVIRLAVEHNFNITNPELQERLQIERERVATERAAAERNLPNVQTDIMEANIEGAQKIAEGTVRNSERDDYLSKRAEEIYRENHGESHLGLPGRPLTEAQSIDRQRDIEAAYAEAKLELDYDTGKLSHAQRDKLFEYHIAVMDATYRPNSIDKAKQQEELANAEQKLSNVRADIIKEANIERAQAAHNSPQHPVHDAATKGEADVARKDAEIVSENAHNPIPIDPAASRQMNALSEEQQQALKRQAEYEAFLKRERESDSDEEYQGQQ